MMTLRTGLPRYDSGNQIVSEAGDSSRIRLVIEEGFMYVVYQSKRALARKILATKSRSSKIPWVESFQVDSMMASTSDSRNTSTTYSVHAGRWSRDFTSPHVYRKRGYYPWLWLLTYHRGFGIARLTLLPSLLLNLCPIIPRVFISDLILV